MVLNQKSYVFYHGQLIIENQSAGSCENEFAHKPEEKNKSTQQQPKHPSTT